MSGVNEEWWAFWRNLISDSIAGIALKEEQDREEAKRNTLSHTPDRKPEADSPRQSRSPLKNDKKEKVRKEGGR